MFKLYKDSPDLEKWQKKVGEEHQLRPCLVDDAPALFHRWADVDLGLLQIEIKVPHSVAMVMRREFRDEGIIPQGCTVEKVRSVCAVVEYADGSVGRVDPELVQFLDHEEG